MNIEKFEPGDQHREIVKAINELIPNSFEVRKGHVNSGEVHEKISWKDVNNMAAFTSRVFNMTGGSVGDIDLYKLFQSYFLDLEKRKEINEIIQK